MPTSRISGRKHSRIVNRRTASTINQTRIVRKEASIKKFVEEFYQKYGKMMSKLSHE
jgi:hypothetical protein